MAVVSRWMRVVGSAADIDKLVVWFAVSLVGSNDETKYYIAEVCDHCVGLDHGV